MKFYLFNNIFINFLFLFQIQDSELYKFKCELEADHNGITEVLEKRSLELDVPQQMPLNPQKENRFY